MAGMTPTVRRTRSGNGAMILVNESDEELAERQQRRRDRVAALQQLEFTPGQAASIRQMPASA